MRASEQQPRAIYELCCMMIQLLKSPPPLAVPIPIAPDLSASSSSSSSRTPQTHLAFSQVSPTGFASLFLGICLALMLVGSVTFIIGFILMPWVIGLVLVFHFVGVVSTLSELCISFVASKDVSPWKFP